MKNILFAALILTAGGALYGQDTDPFADTVVAYTSGSGANPSYENSAVALGAPDAAATVTVPAYQSSNIVSIGLSGSLVVAFNQPILNDANNPFGMDFIIFGNSFFILSGSTINGAYTKPAETIWVSQDNVTYYQLQTTEGADDLYPTEGTGDPNLPVNPDLTLSDFNGLTASQAVSLYDGSAGGTPFDISWAVDSSGDSVNLASISYIKVVGMSSTAAGNVDAFARVDAVPEPAAGGLCVGGMVLTLLIRRRRGL